MNKKNTWGAKAKRMITAVVLPVDKNRHGQCLNCGHCCQLPIKCPFLKYRKNNQSYCIINSVKPPNCRKYPRTKLEHLTESTCGYSFD